MEHDDSGEESVDGNDYADEMASEGTDGEKGGHDYQLTNYPGEGYPDGEVVGYRPLLPLQCHLCREDVSPSRSVCPAGHLNYACP